MFSAVPCHRHLENGVGAVFHPIRNALPGGIAHCALLNFDTVSRPEHLWCFFTGREDNPLTNINQVRVLNTVELCQYLRRCAKLLSNAGREVSPG